ncbi:MAG: alpha/beta hydrolase [Clostridiaceae bacterium]
MEVLRIMVIVIGLLTVLILVVLSSPRLLSFFVKKLFEVPFQTLPKDYEKVLSGVEIKKDIRYCTEGNCTFDAYYPKSSGDENKSYPVIFWAHGGGFVGGDKRDNESFSVMLANEGYVVLCMNYTLAPLKHYPEQLKEIEEFYLFTSLLTDIPMDRNRIFFAGDSAGANLISSFIINQFDEELRKKSGLRQVVDMDKVKGVLFFCGLFDIKRFKDMVNIGLFKVAINQLAYSYLGQKDWKENECLKDTSLLEHLTDQFPRTFITDGNVFSFIEQAKEVERKIKQVGGYVDSLFFDQGTKAIHEYQFKLDTAEGMVALNRTIGFLKEAEGIQGREDQEGNL